MSGKMFLESVSVDSFRSSLQEIRHELGTVDALTNRIDILTEKYPIYKEIVEGLNEVVMLMDMDLDQVNTKYNLEYENKQEKEYNLDLAFTKLQGAEEVIRSLICIAESTE